MTDRVYAGARIPEDTHDLHLEKVREKYGSENIYRGIEADRAIREYLDQDDLAGVEERLRDRCEAVGSSPPKKKTLVDDTDDGVRPRARWRIHPELKEDLKKFATETDNTYGEVFALAIREYWTNSRAERLEALFDRLETAIEPWLDQIGSDGVNATTQDNRATEVVMELDDMGCETSFKRDELETAIAEVLGPSDYYRDTYTPLVTKYKGVEEHPKVEDLFIPRERAEELREDMEVDESTSNIFEQSFGDLSAEDRVLRLRARLYQDAKSRGGKAAMKHEEIGAEFGNEPGRTTVYNLMHAAAEANGFKVASPHGTNRLQVKVREVDDNTIVETATIEEDDTPTKEDARSELDYLTSAEPVQ